MTHEQAQAIIVQLRLITYLLAGLLGLVLGAVIK